MVAQWGTGDWADVEADDWPNLLVGNGLSIAVSPLFANPSLYTVAGLDPAEEAVFTALGTANFELVPLERD